MSAAFISPFPAPASNGRARWVCSASPRPPSPSAPSPDPRSDVDRRYIDKARAKLFSTRRAIDAARIWSDDDVSKASDADEDADAPPIPDLPDDLDSIDDLLYNRGPANAKQVRLFGGWLDDAVAGRKASDPAVAAAQTEKGGQFDVKSHHRISLTKEEALASANDVFATAMAEFNKGKYKQAVGLYEEAVALVGVQSRLGGQYQLWRAQALDAAGLKKEAAAMLEKLRMHADADVRKVSKELLFIITAPRLELEPGSFLDIPALEDETFSTIQPVLTSNYGPLRTALVDKPPERYSLEWYMEKERPPKVVDHSKMDLVLVAAAIGVTLAFMLTTSPS